jgi:hypothetical protein
MVLAPKRLQKNASARSQQKMVGMFLISFAACFGIAWCVHRRSTPDNHILKDRTCDGVSESDYGCTVNETNQTTRNDGFATPAPRAKPGHPKNNRRRRNIGKQWRAGGIDDDDRESHAMLHTLRERKKAEVHQKHLRATQYVGR